MRLLHLPVAVVLEPQANHHLLVENARNFRYRGGSLGALIPELQPGYRLRVRQMPTLSPADGLPIALREHHAATAAA